MRNLAKTALLLLLSTTCCLSLVSCSDDSDEETPYRPLVYTFDEETEVVVKRVMAAVKVTDSLFTHCATAEELAQHSLRIKMLEGLEYVEFNTQGMSVKLKNFIPINYIYPDYGDTESSARAVASQTEKATRALETRNMHKGNNLKTFCIVDQLSHDEGFSYVNSLVRDLETKARKLGMEVTVLRNELEPMFFRYQMYDYDILFILAHGGYSENTGIHSIATSLDFGTNLSDQEVADLYNQLRDENNAPLNPRYFELGVIKEKHTRAGVLAEENHCYLAVTEDYIKEGPFEYGEERQGKAIVFSASCMALKGNNNMGKVFFDKGAAIYLGYTETQTVGVKGGHQYLVSLLSGNTAERAYSDVPEYLREEDRRRVDSVTNQVRSWHASLKIVYNSRVSDAKHMCARCVVTEDADVVDFDNTSPNLWGEEEQGIAILTGSARMLYASSNTYGFYFGKKSDMSDAVKLVSLTYDTLGGERDSRISYDRNKDEVTFHYVFEDGSLKDDEDYYFCAYMEDSQGHYCYGDVKKLKPNGLVNGELGIFELSGPVKSCTFRRGSEESVVRTFDRDGFWLTYNGQSINSIYDKGITRDLQGRIIEGRFDGGFESFVYDARGRIIKYGYLYYDGGNGITYTYGSNGLLEKTVDEPWGMDAEYYDPDTYYYKDYVLDSHGNWIRRFSYTLFSGATENRTIEYFEK